MGDRRFPRPKGGLPRGRYHFTPGYTTHANNGSKVSGDEVPKKLKQNINTVQILTLMMAFYDGTSHDVATKVGTITHLCMGNFRLPPACLVY